MSERKTLPCGRTRKGLERDIKTLEKAIQVIRAAMDGAEVEWKDCYGYWVDDQMFFPAADCNRYRIKPASKRKEK